MQARFRHQVVDVGNPPRDRIFNRDHRQFGFRVVDGGKGVLKSRARHRLAIGISLVASDMGVGAGFALENDRFHHNTIRRGLGRFLNRLRIAHDIAHPLQIGGCINTKRSDVNQGRIDAHARFERAELFKLLAFLKH